MFVRSFKSVNESFLCRWSFGISSKACDVFFRTNTSTEHVLRHFSIFLALLNQLCTQALRKKGCSRVWSMHTFALYCFIILLVKVLLKPQPCLDKRKFHWKSYIGFYAWLSLFESSRVCLCVWVCDKEAEREEFDWLSDKIVSEYSHRGSIRTKTHISRDLLQLLMFCFSTFIDVN